MSGDVEAVVAALDAAVTAWQALELSRCGRDELLVLLRSRELQVNRLASVDADLVGELDARGVAAEVGLRDTRSLLMQTLNLSAVEAGARTAAARQLSARRTLGGEPLPAQHPHVASALRAGAISPSHAREIHRTIDQIPDAVELAYLEAGRQVFDEIELDLVEHARELDSKALAQRGRMILYVLDPDGVAPDESERERRRGLTLTTRADGSGRLEAELTSATAAVWTTVIDSLSAPAPESDGQRDMRTAAQRRHDALADAGERLLRSGSLPDTGGVPVSLILTMSVDQLSTGHGYARTEHGELVPARTAVQLADQAEVTTAVLRSDGAVLSCGITRRLATPAQRRVLVARDRGCSFPGCRMPPTWCQVHHVVPWSAGGRTDVDNLTLVCGHHHRTFARLGWQCAMRDGLPEWSPPDWLDPERRPRRNRAHHRATSRGAPEPALAGIS